MVPRSCRSSFSSRLEAEGLPAVLPVIGDTANVKASAEVPIGASRDGNSER